MTKRLILAAGFSLLLAAPAAAETCEEQLTLLNVLITTEGGNLDDEVRGQVINLRNDAQDAHDGGDEDDCLKAAEEALSLLSQ